MRRLVAILLGLTCTTMLVSPVAAATKTVRFTANVWVDNWFELYVNGKRVGMDTVPFATERSFNAETISFSATYPLTIGLVVRDYVENASGPHCRRSPSTRVRSPTESSRPPQPATEAARRRRCGGELRRPARSVNWC